MRITNFYVSSLLDLVIQFSIFYFIIRYFIIRYFIIYITSFNSLSKNSQNRGKKTEVVYFEDIFSYIRCFSG